MSNSQQEVEQWLANTHLMEYKELFQNVVDELQVKRFTPNSYIVNAYHPMKDMFLLVQGKAKIYMIHEDGKRSLIQFLQKGDLIGELTLLQLEKQQKDVIAIDSCVCLSIPIEIVSKYLLTDSKFLLFLTRYLGAKLLKRTEFFAKNQNYELKSRLAAYLLQMECNGIYKEKHTHTAEFLGISYRHLLYTLNELVKEQYIQKTKLGYEIDRDKLMQLAKDI